MSDLHDYPSPCKDSAPLTPTAALDVKELIRRALKEARLSPSARHFVLDTNVLLHDPMALYQFDEHTLYLPLIVLEELDRHKKGTTDLARNARQVVRALDDMLMHGSLERGLDLGTMPGSKATGMLYFVHATGAMLGLSLDVADNQILAIAKELSARLDATLVTNDINLRVKAMAHQVPAQSYRSDRVLEDEEVLPSGLLYVDDGYWRRHQEDVDQPFWREGEYDFARVKTVLPLNSFLVEATAQGKERAWQVVDTSQASSVLRVVHSSGHQHAVAKARNVEQALAMELLHDPELDLVSLLGQAGTGKTLLALAAGIELVKAGRFKDILITRATVPMGEEIGFLPGTEQDKMNPWLGGTLRDVFSALKIEERDPIRDRIEIASTVFMRGRSFHEKFILIDEAQNLSIRQIKTLLTRAADGSKVVLTGNLGQIDTPYLDASNSGLTWAVMQTLDWPRSGHLILPRGVRSRLATFIESSPVGKA